MTGDVRLAKLPTMVAAFRMSAVMWNAHRVHFDHQYATEVEGHPGVLVPANLLSSYLCEVVMAWGGATSRLVSMTFQTRRPVVVGLEVTAWAREVTRVPDEAGELVSLEIGIDIADRLTAVTGTAVVRLSATAF
jgi:hydroxyacyl-ACP dehydratase HTD2-like protein with hotdog domain